MGILTTIPRSFRDLSDEDVADIEKASALARLGWSGSFGWEELLHSKRILIVSEAGAGKTYECQTQKDKLWEAGEPAFFLDLATLAGSSLRDMLSHEEEERFDSWLRSQSEIATFFLDSIDELKLTLGNFGQALARLNKAITGQLGRARVIITTRPVPIDRELIIKYLPIPRAGTATPSATLFADMVTDRRKVNSADASPVKAWRNVGLMPLSREQIREFAIHQGVLDPDALLADISQRDAEEFAQRPQDLVELCSDWREHHRIRSHREQVETNIAVKLRPRHDRKELAELSQDDAIEGASRIALAAILTRKLTLRYSAEVDDVFATEAALDVSKILPDWSRDARGALLERPLFGFASYGRVRFHHRSVVEFLAAKRLEAQLKLGVSIKSIKRLLFAETAQGTRIVKPSMRPITAWLSIWRDTVFDDVVSIDPTVVLDHGDPQSLRPAQRVRALRAHVNRYGNGGWRGLHTPRIQVNRFVCTELAEAIKSLWAEGIENPEVTDLLLQIIEAGKLNECTDLAHDVAMDPARPDHQRSVAIDALVEWDDPRLEALSRSVTNDSALWPDKIARQAILRLLPTHMPVDRLSQILRRVKEGRRGVGDLTYWLPRRIETTPLLPNYLDNLRQALSDLVVEQLAWDNDHFPHLRTKRPDLVTPLIATCCRQASDGVRTAPWIAASLLAIRISNDDYSEKDALAKLRQAIASLPADAREAAFWEEDALLQELHRSDDTWHRAFDLSQGGGLALNDETDAAWIRKRLSASNEPLEHREMMLWIALRLLDHTVDRQQLLTTLKPLVADAPSLTAAIDGLSKPQNGKKELRRMEKASAKRKKQTELRATKAHASWVTFWREIVRDPNAVFAPDRAENTAWHLWQAVERSGRKSRASGWDRQFIEEQFGKSVADHLRETMMAAWRNDRPTLRSERPEAERNTFLIRWQFGLAGIYAEAEDANWAKRLTEQEAELACRYAPIELNGFPSWLASLAVEHPTAVDRVQGGELSFSLREATNGNSSSTILQNIDHAPAIIAALFIPRIRAWLAGEFSIHITNSTPEHELRQAIAILIRMGNDDDRNYIVSTSKAHLSDGIDTPFAYAWLPALLYLEPSAGIQTLEMSLEECIASQDGLGVQLFGRLFKNDYGGIGIDLRAPGFTPPLLLRLLRLAYRHVRVDDDVHHEGSFSPGVRDNAQSARNAILSAIFATTGPEGWAVKVEMAGDPLFKHIKDRTTAIATQRAAEDADSTTMTEAEFCVLDKTGEAPPLTREEMFSLMRDRLEDIDDLLLQDVSPRELWATIADERVMRRELARVLREGGKGIYTIDQEAVTADEKETDIRFRSAGSSQQGTIELKLGDRRPGTDLFDTLRNQLLMKYMAADDCRAGCLVVTISTDRKWEHPKTGTALTFEELMMVLSEEASRISQELGGAAKLMAKGIDLRPRLTTEQKANRRSSMK
ncbi:hypothetical protein SR870_02370 [Rhodopseudomonas palustris]|uniref:NACHT domain-containing protein n=1 Tax=Rhodopseudomonas palustris TaxID=1076 RepID=UPI002ACE53D3|nr:hypothetical protein [Rhodopseudomonas palustris]WQH00158.1 hypothetical protein SR870_02370 [Rhodopseudomonas palustris]